MVAEIKAKDSADVAMRWLFRTVVPVLPPGKPKPMFGYEHIRVVYEDASTV
ncbi:hypothetical protein [Actinophytocola sp.]|uniref:hypothetical protein n=1 Tax=Actinophytocola sp. TaxID=1872138 RepID=UPI0025C450EA|nr:hypothetical protein [Actinophytocola sp.]